MHKITNRTAQPHDIHTRKGVKAIHANGTLTDDFDTAYLDILRLSFDVEEVRKSQPGREEEAVRQEPETSKGRSRKSKQSRGVEGGE